MRSTVIFSLHFVFVIILCAKKIANDTSNANAVYRQSTRYSCFTEESWARIWCTVGGSFHCNLTVKHNQKPDVYFINGHVKYGFYSAGVCISHRCAMGGLGWVHKLMGWVG